MPRKSGTSGSEGGRRKRTRSTGTSSAAYPTARPVLRGAGRSNVPGLPGRWEWAGRPGWQAVTGFPGRPPLSSGGSARAGRILGQDAELVPLRIGERDPATAIGPPMIGEVRRSQREDPLHLLLAGAIHRAQVKVHPVLHLLAVGDGD